MAVDDGYDRAQHQLLETVGKELPTVDLPTLYTNLRALANALEDVLSYGHTFENPKCCTVAEMRVIKRIREKIDEIAPPEMKVY